MHSTLNPKPSDDPHDFVVVAPDAARVAPSDDELSNLLHKAARYRSDPHNRAATDLPAGPTVPPVDTTFRPAAIDDIRPSSDRPPSHRRSTGRVVLRAVTAVLLTAFIGGAAVAWGSYGDGAEKKIAKWATQFVMAVSQPTEKPVAAAQAAPPAVQADAANAAPSQPASQQPASQQAASPQPAPLEQTPPAGAEPTTAALSPESEQLLQSMARDLASVGQEVAQLKASIEQLKDSQQQMSRDVAKASETKASETKASEAKASSEKASSEAKASERNLRPRRSAPPPQSAAAPARKPIPPYPASQAAARPLPQAGAPYYMPRQPDYARRQIESQPQVIAEPQDDPESESVPRPPMPLR
jgi:hypothetical protein